MRTLVVVVVFNGMPWLDRCLSSVRASEAPADLYVVDNDSTDGSPDYVQGHFPEAKLVRSAENLGFSRANNLGIQYALSHGYDHVYLLNQDAFLEPDTLGRLLAVQDAHPEYAVLSPMQMEADRVSYDKLFEQNVLRKVKSVDTAVSEVPRVMAAHWLLSRSGIEEVGLLAPIFPLYGEDDNWCDRARYHGRKIGIVPSARAVHDRSFREEPLEKTIHRNYFMGSLCRLCDINRPLWERTLFVCLFTAVKAVKYRSILPLKHFRTLMGMMPEIRDVRRLTSARGAFLG